MAINTGVIGLGNIGNGVAKNMLKGGHNVVGYDIDIARVTDAGAQPVDDAAAVAAQSDLVVVAVANIAAYEETMAALANAGKQGLVVADCCTFPEETKDAFHAQLAEAGVTLLDCPVSGARPQSQAGELAMTVSGEKEAFDRVEEALNSFCSSVTYVGEFGMSIKIKYILNLMVAIHNLTCAEAFVMARKAGIDLDLFVDVVSKSSARLQIFNTRASQWVAGDYENNITAALAIQLKDIVIIDEFAKKLDVPTPLFDVASSYYRNAEARGWQEKDAAVILELLEEAAGIPRGSA
ncbi:MAG: NAD-binding protein [Alphaproteobacteria bacterium]|nr:NAD-binding protein [Alphaproteobacteria bacterium]